MRHTMQLGQSINTFDPGDALKGETGKFKLRGPNDEELYLTCVDGVIVGIHWPGETPKPFLITKVTEPANVNLRRSPKPPEKRARQLSPAANRWREGTHPTGSRPKSVRRRIKRSQHVRNLLPFPCSPHSCC